MDLLGDDEEEDATKAVAVPHAAGHQPYQKVPPTAARPFLRSVLKVFATRVDPNYAQPWQMLPQRTTTGSAFVLDVTKRMILTNSHVVTNSTAVYVRRPGLAKKFKAEVLCDGRVCDLALMTVRDDSFWDPSLCSLEMVDVPELQSPVAVVGYPVGGDSLCIAKGIVSRLTMTRYQGAAKLLSIQIDAAINPGNSGGPAFVDLERGKVAGVAFSKNTSSIADNIGYIIPSQVVRHFLDEYDRCGQFRGVPSPGFLTQDMENPALKALLKVPTHHSGVLIVKLDPLSPAATVLKEMDVLMEVDGQPVADDGTIVFRDDERVEYTHLFRSKHVGATVQVKIMREGQEVELTCPLDIKDYLVPCTHGVDAYPSYFIIGGLVFMPLTQPFLEIALGGSKRSLRRQDIPVPLLNAINCDKQERGQQVIILVQVLAHEINHGYRISVAPCETFNGHKLMNLKHMADLVDSCTDQFLKFGLEGGRLVTLDRAEALQHGPQILKVNAIPVDRSDDLAAKEPEASAPAPPSS